MLGTIQELAREVCSQNIGSKKGRPGSVLYLRAEAEVWNIKGTGRAHVKDKRRELWSLWTQIRSIYTSLPKKPGSLPLNWAYRGFYMLTVQHRSGADK